MCQTRESATSLYRAINTMLRVFHKLEQRFEGKCRFKTGVSRSDIGLHKEGQVEIIPSEEGTVEESYLPHHFVKKKN